MHCKKVKRILMTADTIGGVWIYALDLARGLGERGIEVCLATIGKPLNSMQKTQITEVPNLKVYESNFKLEWMQDPWADVERAGEWLLDLERYLKPDLVHLNNYAHGALSWAAPVLVVGHSCVLSWWSAVKKEALPGTWGKYIEAVSRGLKSADFVVTPTQTMLQYLNSIYGPIERGRVIHNGRKLNSSRRSNFIKKDPFILSAGRLWDLGKNIALLDRIAPYLDWPVYVAGENYHPEGGKVDLRNIIYLGALSPEELMTWFSRASIYVLPAVYEPFGLTVLEAAISGCALVLGDIPSLRELWDEAALFSHPNHAANFISLINNLIDDETRCGSLAVKALRRASDFSFEKMIDAYLELYSELAEICGCHLKGSAG